MITRTVDGWGRQHMDQTKSAGTEVTTSIWKTSKLYMQICLTNSLALNQSTSEELTKSPVNNPRNYFLWLPPVCYKNVWNIVIKIDINVEVRVGMMGNCLRPYDLCWVRHLQYSYLYIRRPIYYSQRNW